MSRFDPSSWRQRQGAALHNRRELAETFGSEPELYDRSRPRYPMVMVDRLLGGSVRTVLDVGCGTGIAGSLFAEGGCRILGVEPDPRMARLARRRGLEVEVSSFERWQPRERHFDMAIAAQAWHWIDPRLGTKKAASALRDGGTIAIFWNVCSPPLAVQKEIDQSYSELAPDFFAYSVLLNRGASRVETVRGSLEDHGPFSRPEHYSWRWSRRYTSDEWLEHLITHSDHNALPKERRRPLFIAVSRAFESLGGSAEMRYETHLVVARRRPRE